MYIPKDFEQKNEEESIAFMQAYSFAVLISIENNLPIATHLPFVVEKREAEIVLISHISKANTQWKSFYNQEVLVVFSEPHSYISPTLYEKKQNVPTWNYVAVHAYGNVKRIHDKEKTVAILQKQMQTFEAAYLEQFKKLDEKYVHNLMNGIVAFEITVTRLQSKAKLSQNKTEQERKNIKNHLLESKDTTKQDLGKMM